jgi:uncharacterized protein (DUF2141 family)
MTKALYALLFLSFFTGFSLQAQSDSIGILEIEFTGIRSNEGQMAINISSVPKGFPRKPGIEIQFIKDQVEDGVLSVEIDSLAYGIYAISALDDLNSDMEMEMFLRFPKEGYGFSLNPNNKLRAPKFKECSFELNQPHQTITIVMRYPRKKK